MPVPSTILFERRNDDGPLRFDDVAVSDMLGRNPAEQAFDPGSLILITQQTEELPMNRTTRLLSGLVCAIAVGPISYVLLFPATVGADCENDCGDNNNVCTGSSSGSCQDCSRPPVGCGSSPGITFYTGVATHGSIMGENNVNFVGVPCKKKRLCINGNMVQGECNVFLVCNPAGFGGCQECILGNPMTTSTYQDCRVDPCGT